MNIHFSSFYEEDFMKNLILPNIAIKVDVEIGEKKRRRIDLPIIELIADL